jgi:predicted outer membrane protein
MRSALSRTLCLAALAAVALAMAVQRARAQSAPAASGVPLGTLKARPVNPNAFAPAAAAALGTQRMTAQQREEWRFLKEAAAASRFEGDAARLALARSSSPAVLAYASELADYNRTAGNELQHLLQMRGMAAPMLTDAQRKTLNRLAKMSGKKFDREYVNLAALRSLQPGVAELERAGAEIEDVQVKSWIERNLPSVRDQLQDAAMLAAPAAARPMRTISSSGSR